MTHPEHTHHLAALLDWYRAMGVDDVVGDVAIDWTARGDTAPGAGFRVAARDLGAGESSDQTSVRPQDAPLPSAHMPSAEAARPAPAQAQPRQQTAPPRPPRRTGATPTAPDAAELAAREAAASASSLPELEAALQAFDGCGLKRTAKSLCFYRGSADARLMIIGEAPGRDEDLAGKPFVGRAGQLLDKMLAAIDLSEDDVHITNIVYWRPPGNRTPTPQEAQVCRPFLERQVGLVNPDVLLMLGGPAAKAMLDVTDGL